MKIIFSIIFNLSVLGLFPQYTYFNNTYGELGDQETELISNVEVVGDTIYLFGGFDNDLEIGSFLLRKLDNDGVLIDERLFSYENELTFVGLCKAISSGTDNFLYTQATVDDGTYQGYAVKYNQAFDTLWTKTYNSFYPSIYFRANFLVDGGSFVIGNHSELHGTFILKLDNDGNVVWQSNLQDGDDAIFVDLDILNINSGNLLGGFKRTDRDIAMLTKTDGDGNKEWEYYADNFVDDEGQLAQTGSYNITQLSNGDIVGGHLIWYSFAGDGPVPVLSQDWWMSLRLSKINPEDGSLYWEHDYMMDFEIKEKLMWKVITTQEDGILAMGMDYNFGYPWLLKVDSLGNFEWYKTYEIESDNFEVYTPYDIEMTSDGGFVVVGLYANYSLEGFTQSWVMKIDACGDVEWEGCDYVGIQESKKVQVNVYPNPTCDMITIAGEDLGSKTEAIIYDLHGRNVLSQSLTNQQSISLSHLARGLYQIVLMEEGVIVYSEKIVVE